MSEKLLDPKGRWRTKIIAFRASPEEAEEIDKRVKLCGYQTKQDFVLDSLLHQKVTATGNPLLMTRFRKELQHIETELKKLDGIDQMEEELLTPIRTMLEILEAFAAMEE